MRGRFQQLLLDEREIKTSREQTEWEVQLRHRDEDWQLKHQDAEG